jgi:putative tricarboxylic transport membrane protein
MRRSLRPALPYLAGLAFAAIFFALLGRVEYTPRAGHLGPTFWPMLALGLMALACLYELARIALGVVASAHGLADAYEDAGDGEADGPTYPGLLLGGIALLAAFGFLVPILGFLLAGFLFLASFMYLGRYRNHVAIWLTSILVMFLVALVFVRLAYVSLPRGVPPFDRFTDFMRIILGG